MDTKKLELPGVQRRCFKSSNGALYGVLRKKDFRDLLIREVPGMTMHKANAAYYGYKTKTTSDLNRVIAQALLDGSLSVESVSTFDGQVTLVRMQRKLHMTKAQ